MTDGHAEGLRAARALLRAEGGGLRALRSAARTCTVRLAGAVAAIPRSSPRTMAEQACGLVRDLGDGARLHFTGAVRRQRLRVKQESHVRLAAAWEHVRGRVIAGGDLDPGPLGAPAVLTPTDEAAAAQVGQSLGAAWMSAAVAVVWTWAEHPEEAELAGALSRFDIQLDGRIRRIAATESARAYADGFDEGVGWLAEQHGSRRWYLALFKRWEAANDKRVCPTCRTFGESRPRPIGVPFPGGHEPGYVHAHCRCVPVLMFLPVPWRGDPTPGRQVDDDNPRGLLELPREREAA